MADQINTPGSIPTGPQTTMPSPDGAQPMKVGLAPNPLQKYFRQPKVYLTLPSKGSWYPADALDMPDNKELPVFAMTAKDELTFKTPDALLNGQATVDVIASCVPSIKNPWALPVIDLDAILVAIRMATYGHTLELKTTLPEVTPPLEKTFDLDLRQVLDKFARVHYENKFNYLDMKITTRPQTYKEFTKTATKTFEEQRLFQTINDSDMEEKEKVRRFNESFTKLTAMTIDTVADSISQIQVGEEVVVDPGHISEFINNADKNFFKAVTDHVESQRNQFIMEPVKVQATEEELAKGAPKEYTIPVAFDQANFFG